MKGVGRRLRTALLVGGAVVAAQVVLIVLVGMPVPHNGGDNAGYVALAQQLLEGGGYREVWDPAARPYTKYPPVFPAVLAAWIAAGARTWGALKAVPAAFTVLSVLLAYLWVLARRGPLFAAGVAVLVGLSRAFLWSSQWTLSDPLFVALTLLALWAFDRTGWRARIPGVGGAGKGRGKGAKGAKGANGSGKAGRSGARAGAEAAEPDDDEGTWAAGATDSAAPTGRALTWVALGVAATVLAYFTRTAALPLLVAVGLWLLMVGRRRVLAGAAAVAGVPAILWWLRARGAGGDAYVNEFWLVDPYTPELGRAGAGELAVRVAENLFGYVGFHLPAGLVDGQGPLIVALGLALAAFGAVGWWLTVRRGGAGAGELFAPLYLGLLLLWPQIWSGDRFALPLFPLLLYYAGEGLLAGARRVGRVPPVVVAGVAVGLVGGPELLHWAGQATTARECTALARVDGPFACWGAETVEFAEAAGWAGANLPAGSVVLTRKPRFFYVLSGLTSRTYPYLDDPDVFFAAADSAGARYVVVDYIDSQSSLFLVPVIQKRSEAFCGIFAFGGTSAGTATQLFGILPPERRPTTDAPTDAAVTIARCPDDLARATPGEAPDRRSFEVPLLVRPRPAAGPGEGG